MPDTFLIPLLIIFSYSLGSVPTAYIVGKILRGLDIRNFGSGNVGGSNAIIHIGLIPGIIISSFDVLIKGSFIIFLLSSFLGGNLFIQGLIGLSAVVSHNWSPWIRFSGGRGISVFFGIILGFHLFEEGLIFICLVIIGNLIRRETGFYIFLCMLILPILSVSLHRPVELVLICILGIMILIIKRLLANGEPIGENDRLFVIFNRIIFDRDISNRKQWITRD